MSRDCLSFQVIPQISGLFRDYLYNFEKVQKFYEFAPGDRQSVLQRARRLRDHATFPAQVAGLLASQNRAFGASEATLANLERLRNGAVAAVSGQQVGLLGGPVYTIFKAVSAIRLARDLSSSGIDCVPVFWLATEDHDLAEVNHVTLLNLEGLPEKLQTPTSGANASPVSAVRFGQEIVPLVTRAVDLLGPSDTADALRDSYRPGESFGTAFAKLFARLFADFGLILLDASDPELHALAAPVYRAAIEQSDLLNEALLERGRELRDAGYHEQVKVTLQTTLLFDKQNGARTAIHRANGGFLAGRDRLSREALLARIGADPQRFSPNVLLRPVVQDFLLPTAAYFGGPAEIAYFAQAAIVYRHLLGRATPVLPRFSATLLDARAQRLLGKYGLHLPDFFAGPDALRDKLAAQLVPADLAAEFDAANGSLRDSIARLTASLRKLDATLVRSAERSQRKIIHQFDRLRQRVGNAQLRRSDEIAGHAAWLSTNLYPDKHLQERQIAGISFLARYGKGLLAQLVDAAGSCPDHQLVNL